MRRRKFIILLGCAAAWPFAAMAQQARRTYHLGCLLPSPPNEYVAFFDELRRRGFIEGQNLTVEYRAYGQHVDLIPQYAAEPQRPAMGHAGHDYAFCAVYRRADLRDLSTGPGVVKRA
jgi:hypothetical protein